MSKLMEKLADSSKDTLAHKANVKKFISKLNADLAARGKNHDESKLHDPEKFIFDEYSSKLKGMTYGSDEYKQCLAKMKPALDHHYAVNKHHPEHFKNGVTDMTLIDLCELLADWKASSMRHSDGDLNKSLKINQKRFGYGKELNQIFINTINEYFK